MPDNPRLQVLPDGPFIEIDGDSLFLGRDCHLALHVPGLKNKVVSNRHCCVHLEKDGRWTLEDLGSTNGTWLAGERLKGKTALKTGDVFSLGRVGPKLRCIIPVAIDPGATMEEDDFASSKTLLADDADGSAERPFRVGKTPQVALRHQRTGRQFSAKGYTVVIGRHPETTQVVVRSDEEKHISSQHAEIRFRREGPPTLRDLGSRNGTWLNDARVGDAVPIKEGDRITLGAPTTILLVTKLDY